MVCTSAESEEHSTVASMIMVPCSFVLFWGNKALKDTGVAPLPENKVMLLMLVVSVIVQLIT